jgi:hypothetical protein
MKTISLIITLIVLSFICNAQEITMKFQIWTNFERPASMGILEASDSDSLEILNSYNQEVTYIANLDNKKIKMFDGKGWEKNYDIVFVNYDEKHYMDIIVQKEDKTLISILVTENVDDKLSLIVTRLIPQAGKMSGIFSNNVLCYKN